MPTPVNLVTATSLRAITVRGGDLFELALTYLGDATQWERIADLNGLDDPILPPDTRLDLILPPANAAASG